MVKLKQIHHHYLKWEDFKSGFYKIRNIENEEELITKSATLLSDAKELYIAMRDVSNIWIIASEVNFTNTSCNRVAWLGQAACCFRFGTPEHLTREAWHRLSIEQQEEANKVAEQVIQNWENKYLSQKELQQCLKEY